MIISDNYIPLYTSSKQASQILYILKKYTSKTDIIVDANAGMGGNSLYFCKFYDFVYCIDTEKSAITYLEHNLKNYSNKFIINNTCLEILKIIKYDIIFFDPPWGGSTYKFKNKIDLYLDDINIIDIINNLYYYKEIKFICLKAPFNFNDNFITNWYSKNYNIYKSDNITILFKFIIFKRKN
tara:strand:+ start:312 stop:857 length:546 start_codon:yes stop_codon:yes gene_type:complete